MKQLWIYILLCALCTGCRNTEPTEENDGIDRTKLAEVVLSTINVAGGNATSRSGSAPSPMKVGERFRLYALERGVTDLERLITTRTYTIKNEAGVPILDNGQAPLYLPIGDLDIFLVGPIQVDFNAGTDYGEDLFEVATPSKVFPRNGIDLIASRTEMKVEVGTNQFVANALEHKMARTEIVVQRPAIANYTDLKVNTIFISGQEIEGEFTFDEHGGTISSVGEGPISVYPTIIEETPGERFTTVSYLLPRKKEAQMRIGVYFTCLQKGLGVADRRLESGVISGIALVGGEINRFTTQPQLSNELELRYRLLPWTDTNMPEDNLPTGEELLFSYSGIDKPMTIDGKRYWRDRSGQERHALLVGDIVYDEVEHCYYSHSPSAYIQVPEVGNVPIYTLEVTAESTPGNESKIASFTHQDTEYLSLALPTTGNSIEFSAGLNKWKYAPYPNDKGYLTNLTTYAFVRNATQVGALRNGVSFGTNINITGTQTDAFSNNRLLSTPGAVSPTKLYAVRLTAKDLSTGDALKQNYRNDMAAFAKADVAADATLQNYIKEGLILDLRGSNPPTTIDGNNVWKDESGMANHALLYGFSGATSNYYQFDGSKYMRLLNSLGGLQHYTVEFVFVSENTVADNVLFHFSSQDKSTDYREFYANFATTGVQIDSPYQNARGDDNRWNTATDQFPYLSFADRSYQYSVTRMGNVAVGGVSMKQCGLSVAGPTIATSTPLNEMKFCYIGQDANGGNRFKGKLYAVRVYNRVLTDKERQINYLVDKTKYNLLY